MIKLKLIESIPPEANLSSKKETTGKTNKGIFNKLLQQISTKKTNPAKKNDQTEPKYEKAIEEAKTEKKNKKPEVKKIQEKSKKNEQKSSIDKNIALLAQQIHEIKTRGKTSKMEDSAKETNQNINTLNLHTIKIKKSKKGTNKEQISKLNSLTLTKQTKTHTKKKLDNANHAKQANLKLDSNVNRSGRKAQKPDPKATKVAKIQTNHHDISKNAKTAQKQSVLKETMKFSEDPQNNPKSVNIKNSDHVTDVQLITESKDKKSKLKPGSEPKSAKTIAKNKPIKIQTEQLNTSLKQEINKHKGYLNKKDSKKTGYVTEKNSSHEDEKVVSKDSETKKLMQQFKKQSKNSIEQEEHMQKYKKTHSSSPGNVNHATVAKKKKNDNNKTLQEILSETKPQTEIRTLKTKNTKFERITENQNKPETELKNSNETGNANKFQNNTQQTNQNKNIPNIENTAVKFSQGRDNKKIVILNHNNKKQISSPANNTNNQVSTSTVQHHITFNNNTENTQQTTLHPPLDKIIEHIDKLNNLKPPISKSLTLQLDPPHLGNLHIKVSIDAQKNLTATIAVHDKDTYKTIVNHVDSLKEYLVNNGIKVQNIDVHNSFNENFLNQFSTNSGSYQQQGQASGQQQSQHFREFLGNESRTINTQQQNTVRYSNGVVDVTV